MKKELEKKQVKWKIVISIIWKRGETWVVFDKVKLWWNFKYWDKICLKNENWETHCSELKEKWIISKLINDYGLWVWTQFRVYYNWWNGWNLIEIIKE